MMAKTWINPKKHANEVVVCFVGYFFTTGESPKCSLYVYDSLMILSYSSATSQTYVSYVMPVFMAQALLKLLGRTQTSSVHSLPPVSQNQLSDLQTVINPTRAGCSGFRIILGNFGVKVWMHCLELFNNRDQMSPRDDSSRTEDLVCSGLKSQI
ncbi:hypothetical protein VNO77_42811 [Canavalia gladiata]|uniref:Uncharacterized protein n=1 Tax=Canavalia gladiata TaxID=3824 RepID=A0AAN9JTN0_CANGL